jgi:hypothetical protein
LEVCGDPASVREHLASRPNETGKARVMQAFRLHHLLHGSGRWSEGSERRRLVFELRQPVHDA